MSSNSSSPFSLDSHEIFLSQELSWLAFASRVLAMAEDPDVPLLERVKFTSIVGMLHDEFFMKRMSGLMRILKKQSTKLSIDGRLASDELDACRMEIQNQTGRLAWLVTEELRPALAAAGLPILDYEDLQPRQAASIRDYLLESVAPILTPLAVDSEHPFPFISNLGLNLAVLLPTSQGNRARFARIKVPDNRPRWIPVPGGGWVPLEQVIAANLDVIAPSTEPQDIHLFRVTRGAEGEVERSDELPEDDSLPEPGSILRQVSRELKARRFAGVVRLQIDPQMPKKFRKWMAKQIDVNGVDVYPTPFLGLRDLAQLDVDGRDDLRFPHHEPAIHARLPVGRGDQAIFEEIARGEILLHHPYHSFDDSVLRFIKAASTDPDVLAIKLTIYRTSSDSPIVRALAEAARRGKQVAVLVEITARFDEAPNIAWGQYLENEGVHVSYGVERLKTHVKLALVVREERGQVCMYAHVGTGNYHSGTARLYEDIGVLTKNREICDDVAMVFNSLTGAAPLTNHKRLLVAPVTMRERFVAMIEREAEHARAGRPSGIDAKMNQLQDTHMIRALYRAAQAGVPIRLNVRGVCCLRPGVPGLSDNIRVFSIIGRFLEHSRVFRFANGGEPEYYIGSADWMRRNLDRRVETAMPITDIALQRELDEILEIYRNDDCSAWDSDSEGVYTRRMPTAGKRHHAAQDELVELAEKSRAALRPVKVIAQPTIDLPTAVGTNDAHIEKDGRRDESGAPDVPAARQSRRETH